MRKYYEAKIMLEGTVPVEDPRCPYEWKGSGCYDIDVACSQAADWTTAIAQHEYIRKDVLLDKLKFALKLRDDGNPNSNDDGVQTIKAMINYIESL